MTILNAFKGILKKLGRILYRLKWWILGAVGTVFLIFSLFYPLDYYIEMPGGSYDVRSVLTVNKKADKDKGSYNFVAVSVSQATLAQLIYAWLTPHTEISTAAATTGGYSNEDYMRINQYYMETSQNTATYQALTLAGKDVKLDYQGVYVLNVTKNSTFKGLLHLADTVTGVNGKTFKSSQELMAYVADLDLGSKVTVQEISNGKTKEVSGKIIELPNGKNGIGIGLVDHTKVSSDVDVTFDTSGVGGPSAGLMFTLDIYDQVNNEDLRKGRKIAGTGTIESDGSVGDIGGAGLKVVSAAKSGADIFFVPNNPVDKETLKKNPDAKTNYEEAKEAAKDLDTDMKIVPVKNVQEAIDYLRSTN
ncbi:SepM family pheromone-processing serine protease [Streptococcus infantarius]|uniref:SepM family pheromone-processing serine protease n=1 Tax=Streptococcus infantarius TaxID=102684 RepID=UPI0022DFC55F|nr:SepM family pheromone-processing serine protease [Streptococcus infantarius]